MKTYQYLLIFGLLLLTVIVVQFFPIEYLEGIIESEEEHEHEESAEGKLHPSDYFFRQRAYPFEKIDHPTYVKALNYRHKMLKRGINRQGTSWEFAGPTNVGGRVTDVEMFADDLNTIFVGSASGGIFKSTNQGESWSPIFDEALSLSIGDMALSTGTEKVIYVGTGEANAGGSSLAYDGIGVYKSKNQGKTWEWKGLANVGSIGKVVIDPTNTDKVYVAAMGQLFANNGERGVYRSQDGGDNWEQILFLSDSTGAIDLAIHPTKPDILYAAMWERTRRVNDYQYGGSTSGIYKSVDGGENWVELTNGLPVAASEKGRIGIAISTSNPKVLMAMYSKPKGELEGIYRSIDGGESWKEVGRIQNSPFTWWYGKIYINPLDANKVFATGLDLYQSTNGGEQFFNTSNGMHVDQHAVYIHPLNTDFVIAGNDGGVYISQNSGKDWTKKNNLPITQFYTCEIDASAPNRLYGGTQDNGTNRTLTGNLDDWEHILGGDGFRVLVDPTDNHFVYGEYQNGIINRSTNGGYDFSRITAGIYNSDRTNWNAPLVFDTKQSNVLYFGTHRIYKTDNRGINWTAITSDLSKGKKEGEITFGTITSIDVSAIDNKIIYAGTDDGNVWNTLDGGSSWHKISDNLPNRWVTAVVTDPVNSNTAYVIFSGYRFGENIGHIYKTINNGESWEDITGDLPDVPLNDLIVNEKMTAHLFVASDIGVFQTVDGGANWQLLAKKLPSVPVMDLDFYAPSSTLIAATYGRGLYRYKVPETSIAEPKAAAFQVAVFPLRFSNQLNIHLDLKTSENFQIILKDVEDKKIQTIHDGLLPEGRQILTYNRAALSNGRYYCEIQNGKDRMRFEVEAFNR